ncbi:MAG: hypothetical protein JO349_09510 [Candidatus Eremiobacteraeota bacterium]|nr:hypothetical protein [Candidatus Eremiobacteraeota bacterium]
MAQRTAFLSKLIGLYCLLYGLSMLVHRQVTIEEVAALVGNPAAILLTGVIVLPAGIAIVLVHNVWRGGPLPVIVTLIGWATLLKGLALVFLPPSGVTAYMAGLGYEHMFYLYAALTVIIGAYLTYGGFRSASVPR